MSSGTAVRRPAPAWWHVALVIVTVGLALWLGYRLRIVLTPFVVALILAYILNPIVSALQKRGVPRTASILGLYVLFFGAMTLILIVGIGQAIDFAEDVFIGEPTNVDTNQNGVWDPGEFIDRNNNRQYDGPKIAQLGTWVEKRLAEILGEGRVTLSVRRIQEQLKGHETEIAQTLGKAAQAVVAWATASVEGVLSVLSFFLLVPIYLFFLLKNMDAIWQRTQGTFPPRHRERVLGTLGKIHRVNAAFFRGQLTIAAIEGTILATALTIFGVRFSLLFGVLYAIAALIPFVGVTIAFLVTELFVFVDSGGSFTTDFWLVAGTFLSIQVLESTVLQPLILGRETGIHPLAVILSIFIFGELFGFFGVLLAIPLASATMIVLQDYFFPIIKEVTQVELPETHLGEQP